MYGSQRGSGSSRGGALLRLLDPMPPNSQPAKANAAANSADATVSAKKNKPIYKKRATVAAVTRKYLKILKTSGNIPDLI